jgi:hypothetical protein
MLNEMLTRVSQLKEKICFVLLALGQLCEPCNKDDIEIYLNLFNVRGLKHSPYSFCFITVEGRSLFCTSCSRPMEWAM